MSKSRKGKASRGSSARKRAVRVAARKRTSGFEVKWHKEADAERAAITDSSERVAIQNVIAKLEVDGSALRAPHQSGVKGAAGEGLRELRPSTRTRSLAADLPALRRVLRDPRRGS